MSADLSQTPTPTLKAALVALVKGHAAFIVLNLEPPEAMEREIVAINAELSRRQKDEAQ